MHEPIIVIAILQLILLPPIPTTTKMAMEYVNYIKAKTNLAFAPKSEKPVLSDEDEKFLDRVITDENPPALPPRPDLLSASEIKDAQIALMDGAQNIPLPETPQETSDEVQLTTKSTTETPVPPTKQSRSTWSWFSRDSRDTKREATATGLQDIAEGLKANKSADVTEEVEAKKEEEEMTMMMEKLNLAAVNNRVFSISDETQELLQNFNQVLKDLMNGVPTAYHDLEQLLARGDKQLSETFSSLPSFLQKLIEKLPETMTKGIAPEVMAAAAQRATQAGINVAGAGKAAGTASKIAAQLRTPNLKELVGKPSAIANTMRTVLAYLRARFPAFMGMNVLWSLALFGKSAVHHL